MKKVLVIQFFLLPLFVALIIPSETNAADINEDLIKAVENGDTVKVLDLLQKGADVNTTGGTWGGTALMEAVWRPDAKLELVRILLDAGADINERDSLGTPILTHAASQGHTEIVKAIIHAGADVNAKGRMFGNTALQIAVRDGHIRCVRVLLDSDADVNATDQNGMTALMSAAAGGHIGSMRVLIDSGADVNAKSKYGTTALILAARSSHIETVRVLLNADSHVNAKDNDGQTALMFAKNRGRTEIVDLLKKTGANEPTHLADASEPTKEANAPDIPTDMLEAIEQGQTEKVILLLAAGLTDPNARDRRGRTVLMLTAWKGMSEIVQHLLNMGIDPNIKDQNGKTALLYASEEGHTATVELLKQAGAKE